MTTERRNIQVLVVSRDISILHEIAWMLDAVGYDVQTSTEMDQDALWHRYSLADVVILDGREVKDPAKEIFGHDSDRPYYRIFLYNSDQATDFGAWFAAGAHDGLRTPVSRGELLSRIRSRSARRRNSWRVSSRNWFYDSRRVIT
jgi:DNA-binding response OmpR family regulator